MHYITDQQRYLIVLGDAAERVADQPDVTVLDRVDRVILAEASYRAALQLRRVPDLLTHTYEREGDARRVFELFLHP